MTQRQETFLRIAERLGVPVAVMVFMCMMLWAAGSWLANSVAEPLVQSHVKFLNSTEENNREQTAAWKAITTIEQEQLNLLREIHQRQPPVGEIRAAK